MGFDASSMVLSAQQVGRGLVERQSSHDLGAHPDHRQGLEARHG